MSDKKNAGRKALDENNLENVSGGNIQKTGDGYWVDDFIPGGWSSMHVQPHEVFDTLEEAEEYDRKQSALAKEYYSRFKLPGWKNK